MEPVTVDRVAILYDGEIYTAPRPKRHDAVIKQLVAKFGRKGSWHNKILHGFLLSDGHFVDRYEARDVAEKAGQLIVPVAPGMQLTSEDVW